MRPHDREPCPRKDATNREEYAHCNFSVDKQNESPVKLMMQFRYVGLRAGLDDKRVASTSKYNFDYNATKDEHNWESYLHLYFNLKQPSRAT